MIMKLMKIKNMQIILYRGYFHRDILTGDIFFEFMFTGDILT